jgi:hypothetical protein
MSEKANKTFFLKIDVSELDDKSFSFKVEGTIPVAIQEAIKTAITGIKTVGPEVTKVVLNVTKNAEKDTQEAKEKFRSAVGTENVKAALKKYVLENIAAGKTMMNLEDAAKELNLSQDQVSAAYTLLVDEGIIQLQPKEKTT